MGKTCYERVKAAVDLNVPLSDKERCFCYLSVDAATASSMQCRTMAAKYNTMAQEYSLCSAGATEFAVSHPGRCDLNKLLPVVGQMGDSCQSEVNRAIWNDTPLTNERRCQFYGWRSCRARHGKVRWYPCNIFSTQDDAAAAIARLAQRRFRMAG